MVFIGIDLAWAEKSGGKTANESGVIMLDADGKILQAGWAVGIQETIDWLEKFSHEEALLFVDAPLVVNNPSGQRLCEKQVGQRYGRWKVSANSTNANSPRLAGVELRKQLEQRSWIYSDGCDGPPRKGRYLTECYPYTTIVGAEELGYENERPVYKRQPKKMKRAEFRPIRAKQCDELIRRVANLSSAIPPMDLTSHPETLSLVKQPSPISDTEYKHREDLLDASLCAWTASLWVRLGEERCQVLGRDDFPCNGLRSTIIAPARKEQRRGSVTVGS